MEGRIYEQTRALLADKIGDVKEVCGDGRGGVTMETEGGGISMESKEEKEFMMKKL